MIEDIKSALNRNGTVAFTTDLWTDIRSRHFVSVTGHYIKEGQVSCYTLCVHEFEERIVPCQITQKKTILNPTLSEFNEIWHTCWFWPTNLKSQILRWSDDRFPRYGFFFENLEEIRGSAQLQNTIARERSVFCGNTVCKKRSTLSASSVKSLVVVNSTSKNKLTWINRNVWKPSCCDSDFSCWLQCTLECHFNVQTQFIKYYIQLFQCFNVSFKFVTIDHI